MRPWGPGMGAPRHVLRPQRHLAMAWRRRQAWGGVGNPKVILPLPSTPFFAYLKANGIEELPPYDNSDKALYVCGPSWKMYYGPSKEYIRD